MGYTQTSNKLIYKRKSTLKAVGISKRLYIGVSQAKERTQETRAYQNKLHLIQSREPHSWLFLGN